MAQSIFIQYLNILFSKSASKTCYITIAVEQKVFSLNDKISLQTFKRDFSTKNLFCSLLRVDLENHIINSSRELFH